MLCWQSSYYSKLEKADILEMTVKYLKNLKRQNLSGWIMKMYYLYVMPGFRLKYLGKSARFPP